VKKRYVQSNTGCGYKAVLYEDGVGSVGHNATLALTATTWNTWTIPEGARNFTIQARGGAVFRMTFDTTHTDYLTVKANAVFNMSEFFGQGGAGSSGVVLHFYCASNETLELLWFTDGASGECQD
jgi:hypothetical protein